MYVSKCKIINKTLELKKLRKVALHQQQKVNYELKMQSNTQKKKKVNGSTRNRTEDLLRVKQM